MTNNKKIRYVTNQPKKNDAKEIKPEPAPKPAKGKSGKKGGGGKKRRIWPWILLAVLLIAVGIGVKFLYDIQNYGSLFNQDPVSTMALEPSVETAGPQASAEPTPDPTPDPEQLLLSQSDLEFMKSRVNILVLGVDESTERENWGSFRTDTMILVTIDFDTKDVTMISIPRDSYIKICNGNGNPTGQQNRVNTAFPAGGGAKKNGYLYAMGTVSHLFGGIPINYYFGFNMNVVKEIVNAMGGVDYDVDVEVNMNGRHLDTGMQHLDGQAVLDYCRQRKGDSDIHRVDRQQRMLMAIFQQLKTTGQIPNIPNIYKAVEQNVQTNLSFTQISSLAYLALQMDMDQLSRHTVEGTSLRVGKASCWGLNMGKLKTLINTVFGISVTLDEEMDGSNVRARIQEAQAAMATELSAADAAVANATALLNNYGAYLSADAQSQLKSLTTTLSDEVEKAIDVSSRDSIVYYTDALNQMNQYCYAQLGMSGGPDTVPQQQEGLPGDPTLNPALDPALDPGQIPVIPDLSGTDLPVG